VNPERVLDRLLAPLLRQFGSKLRYLSLKPFDESTAEGRAQERHRRLALSALAAALAKLMAVLTTLISIPLALRYLGDERFGVWSTLSALVLTLQFADLGLGNGVVNTVSSAHGAGDRAALRRYVSSAAFALLGVCCALLLLALVAVPLVPWPQVFNLKGAQVADEVLPSVTVFAVCVALAVPLGLVQRVQMALQRGFIGSAWQCVASVVSVLAIWLCTQFQLGLPWLVLALLGAPLVAGLFNAILFFGRTEPDLRPRRADVTRAAATTLLRTGASFFVIQVAVAIVFASDSIVIAHLLGAAEVAHYAVPEKVFSVISLVVATAVGPLWPAYSAAIARGDLDWVRRTLKRSLMLAGLFTAGAALLLCLIGPWLIHLWVGDAVQVPTSLLLALGVWKMLEGIGFALGMFLNGGGQLRFQIITAWTMALCVVVLKPVLVLQWGLAGAPMTTALVYAAITLLPLSFVLPAMLRGMRRRHIGATVPAAS